MLAFTSREKTVKVAIFGAGQLGVRIVSALVDGNYDITLVDINEKKLFQLAQQLDVFTVTGDVKSLEMLKSIDIGRFDFVF